MTSTNEPVSGCLQLLGAIDQELRAQPGEPDQDAAQALYWQIEDSDPQLCPLDELEDLLRQARDDFTRGYLAGVYAARFQVQIGVAFTR